MGSSIFGHNGDDADDVGVEIVKVFGGGSGTRTAANRDGYVFTTVNTVINTWQFLAFRALSNVAATLGRSTDATAYAHRAVALRTAINRNLLDRAAGRYRDGLGTSHTAQHASAFPGALGVADAADLTVLGAWLSTGGMRVSVYGAQFLLDALYRCGRGAAAHALLTGRAQASWLHMIDDLGATMTTESWDPAIKPNTTFSHAWGSAPANVVGRRVAGVEVLSPGAALVLVAPQPGPIAQFSATVPSVRGPVVVSMDRRTGFNLAVTLPPNTDGRIELDLAQLGISNPDALRVESAGPAPGRTVAGGRLVLTGVAPGLTRIF